MKRKHFSLDTAWLEQNGVDLFDEEAKRQGRPKAQIIYRGLVRDERNSQSFRDKLRERVSE